MNFRLYDRRTDFTLKLSESGSHYSTRVISILATGMVCSAGLNTAAACAAVRAIRHFVEVPYCHNEGAPVRGTGVLDLPLNQLYEKPLCT
jgi:hypothetical protein